MGFFCLSMVQHESHTQEKMPNYYCLVIHVKMNPKNSYNGNKYSIHISEIFKNILLLFQLKLRFFFL